MSNRGYKRSWKNLLINKRYQLRFTLFMVGLSAVLMVGLGFWVMRTVDETTRVAMSSERGVACPKIPEVAPPPKHEDEDSHRRPFRLISRTASSSTGPACSR